jgi:lactate permease
MPQLWHQYEVKLMWQVVVSPYGMFASALIAFLPLLWLLVSLGWIKMPAYKACIIGFVTSIIIAIAAWGMPVTLALGAALEGVVLAIWPIIWVIIAAIFAYNITTKTGAMEKIKDQMASLSGDRRIQALIIAWGFGGFLEAVAGYGTAVAIPASILAALGFDPIFAAVICLIANTVPTAFGAVGIPVTTLAKIGNLDVNTLSYLTGIQLTLFIVLIPLVLVVMTTKSLKGLKGVWMISLASGISFAIPQLLAAKLNILNGATCDAATAAISDADQFLATSHAAGVAGAPALQEELALFNEGNAFDCPEHCA